MRARNDDAWLTFQTLTGLGLVVSCVLVLSSAPLQTITGDSPPLDIRLDTLANACRRASVPSSTPRFSVNGLMGLAGNYRLVMVAEGASRTRAFGSLSLWIPDSARQHFTADVHAQNHTSPRVVFPLAGSSDINLSRFGAIAVAYPVSSRDPDRPGVQGDSTGTLVLGNAIGHHAFTIDAGVYLHVTHLDADRFDGEWEGAGPVEPSIHGYFCATRQKG